MISIKSIFFLIIISLFLSACDKSQSIPASNDAASPALEDDIVSIRAETEKEALSIKKAAAQAVQIIEQDAKQEIDSIAPIKDLEPIESEKIEIDNISKSETIEKAQGE